MNDAKKRKMREWTATVGILFILAGIVLVVLFREAVLDVLASRRQAYTAEQAADPNTTLKPGDRVKVDVKTSLGYYHSEPGKHHEKEDGVTDVRHYLIPVFTDEAELKYDRALAVAKYGDFKKLDFETNEYLALFKERLEEEQQKSGKATPVVKTYSLPEEPLYTVDGRVRRLTTEERNELGSYYADVMRAYEWLYTFSYRRTILYDDEQYKDLAPSYLIVPLWSAFPKNVAYPVTISACVAIGLGLVFIVFALCYGRTKRIKEKDSSTEGAL